jgi:type IV pilus assembly protein PilO
MRFGLRELIFFLVLLAVPVASYAYVFKPRNDQIKAATQEVEAKQSKLEQLAAVTAKLDDLGLAIERGRQSIEVIEAKLPSEKDVEGILEQVWQKAKANRLTVKSVKSEKPVPAATYMELPLKVIMEGKFDGFYQFLIDLEDLPRITRIHDMKLARSQDRGGSQEIGGGFMRAEFSLSIYFHSRSGGGQ